MKSKRIFALIGKDLSLYFRNRFISVITVLSLVMFVAFYFIMPDSVDENLTIGFYAPFDIPGLTMTETQGIRLVPVSIDSELQEGVIEGKYIAGIALPEEAEEYMEAQTLPDSVPAITLYLASDVPEYIRSSITSILQEFAWQAAGEKVGLVIREEIIGEDLLGAQIPPRDRLRPMLAVLIIMFETFGLANLIAEEIESGTARALLVTPMSVNELFLGKGLFGIGLALVQSVLFMLIIGGFAQNPLLILFTLILASIMATAIGFFIGSLAKDFMSVLAWGMILFIILIIPAFGIMFPGAVTGWIDYIPSYYLVDMMHRVAGFRAGWGDVWSNILILTGFSAAVFCISIFAIRRKAL